MLRHSHRFRFKELYKTDTWSHWQGRVTGRKYKLVVQEIQTDGFCSMFLQSWNIKKNDYGFASSLKKKKTDNSSVLNDFQIQTQKSTNSQIMLGWFVINSITTDSVALNDQRHKRCVVCLSSLPWEQQDVSSFLPLTAVAMRCSQMLFDRWKNSKSTEHRS